MKRHWDLLFLYLRPQWFKVFPLFLLLLTGIGLQLASPQILRYFIDAARGGGATDTLAMAAALFLGAVLVQQIVTISAAYLSESVAWTATNSLSADLAQHCLRLDLPFHHAHTPGEMIERINGDVNSLSGFFSEFVIRVLGNSLLIFGIIILLFREDWRMGLAVTGFAGLTLVALKLAHGLTVPHVSAYRQATAELSGFWQERLSGREDIRANGAVDYVKGWHHHWLREVAHKGRWSFLMGRVFLGAWEVLATIGVGAIFALGAQLSWGGMMTIGTLYLVFHYTSLVSWNLMEITAQMNNLQVATASLERITELLRTQSKIQDGPGARLPAGPLSVEFKHVFFSYVEGDAVLQDICFRLESGKILGLLGRTGSGKTTLTRLLLRLYDPDSGVITLGDVDLRALSLAELRRHVGMVTQEVQLFHATVRDNLTFFDSGISDAQILQVIHELGLAAWYRSLPEGLDTELSSGAGALSAGEAQLLAFGRVFLKNPGLVILDEASSRLDPVTEQFIELAVDRLLQNRTAIVIAHRLSTLERADEVLIVEENCVREHGMRRRLAVDSQSRYYKLLQTGFDEVLV